MILKPKWFSKQNCSGAVSNTTKRYLHITQECDAKQVGCDRWSVWTRERRAWSTPFARPQRLREKHVNSREGAPESTEKDEQAKQTCGWECNRERQQEVRQKKQISHSSIIRWPSKLESGTTLSSSITDIQGKAFARMKQRSTMRCINFLTLRSLPSYRSSMPLSLSLTTWIEKLPWFSFFLSLSHSFAHTSKGIGTDEAKITNMRCINFLTLRSKQ